MKILLKKYNESSGIDGIPAAVLKLCRKTLSSDITIILNYIAILSFVNALTDEVDIFMYNGGFINNIRTTDNLFI